MLVCIVTPPAMAPAMVNAAPRCPRPQWRGLTCGPRVCTLKTCNANPDNVNPGARGNVCDCGTNG